MQANQKIKPKKHYGQNFIKDSIIIDKILQASSELYKSTLASLEHQAIKPLESKIAQTPQKAKKTRGKNLQAFDTRYVIDSSTDALDKKAQNLALVEIGVGLGDLSKQLLSVAPLIAYEIDETLCSFVLQRFRSENLANDFDLRQVDVLSLPFAQNAQKSPKSPKNRLAKNKQAKHNEENKNTMSPQNLKSSLPTFWLATMPYVLISNLPYYIATRIILTALKDPLCLGFVVMTQKEVADKFCATSGDSEFCALSVLAQSMGEVKWLFDVPKEAFNPMPKVTSSVFSLRKITNTNKVSQAKKHFDALDSKLDFYEFENLLKIAFASPRKKLFSNLATRYEKTALEEIFALLNLPLEIRAHELCTQDYHHIFTKLHKI